MLRGWWLSRERERNCLEESSQKPQVLCRGINRRSCELQRIWVWSQMPFHLRRAWSLSPQEIAYSLVSSWWYVFMGLLPLHELTWKQWRRGCFCNHKIHLILLCTLCSPDRLAWFFFILTYTHGILLWMSAVMNMVVRLWSKVLTFNFSRMTYVEGERGEEVIQMLSDRQNKSERISHMCLKV